MKSTILADPEYGHETCNGQWAQDVTERYLPKMRLFAQGAMTNVGILHEPGHAEPWYPGSSAVCEV
jgi:hypothetical protein